MSGRIAVGVSGAGSNLRALHAAVVRGELGAEIVLVFADRACPAIDWVAEQGIATRIVEGGDDTALAGVLAEAKPDAVVLVVNPHDAGFTVQHFARSLHRGIEPMDEVFRQVAREARVDARTPQLTGEKHLWPYWARLYEWAFGRIAGRCRDEGIRLVLVYLPTVSGSESYRKETDQLMDLGRKAGLTVINLEGTYGRTAPESLEVAPWDSHPNARGHRLIADRLFAELVAETGGLFEQRDEHPAPRFGADEVGQRLAVAARALGAGAHGRDRSGARGHPGVAEAAEALEAH